MARRDHGTHSKLSRARYETHAAGGNHAHGDDVDTDGAETGGESRTEHRPALSRVTAHSDAGFLARLDEPATRRLAERERKLGRELFVGDSTYAVGPEVFAAHGFLLTCTRAGRITRPCIL